MKQGWAYILFKRTQRSCFLLRSFQKNAAFSRSFAFFIKRTPHSLHSFMFFIKERCVLCVLLRSLEKNAVFFAFFYVLLKRMRRSLRSFMFFIKECGVLCILLHSLQKNVGFFAFFYVLSKRMLRSLHSFTFLRKERIVLLGLISRQKLVKRTQKNIAYFKRMQITMRSKRKRTLSNPAMKNLMVIMRA